MPLHVLFICSQNRLRSPTAEQVFADYPGIECTSAGLNHDAENPLTPELVEWADLIFVMETTHRARLGTHFRQSLHRQRIISLGIPDDFAYMDPGLIRLLTARVTPHLPAGLPVETTTSTTPLLLPHDPAWATEFAALRRVYETTLGDLVVRVEHVGSTAVPGLLAKPVIDIDLVMRDYSAFPAIVAGLATLGYVHNGDQGIAEREAFKRLGVTGTGTVEQTPLTEPRRQWMLHHLYVCPEGGRELGRHTRFRDALRANADWRAEYARLKQDIAARSDGDRAVYSLIKEDYCLAFVERVLASFVPS